jgi:hypothetical protein
VHVGAERSVPAQIVPGGESLSAEWDSQVKRLCPSTAMAPDPTQAVMLWGFGGIEQGGMLVVATSSFKLYRAHGNKVNGGPCGTGGAAARGGWWAFVDPSSSANYASKSVYRKAVGVCLSWNSFSHVVRTRAFARRPARVPGRYPRCRA